MARKYKLACVVGRFQPFHLGHKKIIDKALEVAERVIVCIGSSQEDGTEKNPFDWFTRMGFIDDCYNILDSRRIFYLPLVDIGAGDSPIWGNYIKNTIKFKMGEFPDVYIQGSETDRAHWLDYEEIVVVDRSELKVSGTQVRVMLNLNKEYILTHLTNDKLIKSKVVITPEFIKDKYPKDIELFKASLLDYVPEKSRDRLVYSTLTLLCREINKWEDKISE